MSSLVLLLTACATSIQAELDAEVKRLCAIDGGVRVFEAVKLPSSRFSEQGQINFFRPDQGENALGPEYIYKWTTHYYKRGEENEVAMWRSEHRIIRRSDGKVLGAGVRYSRRGGDVPSPSHPSSFTCPPISRDQPSLESSVFLKGDKQ